MTKQKTHIVSMDIRVISDTKVEAAAICGAMMGQAANNINKWRVSEPETIEVPDERPAHE